MPHVNHTYDNDQGWLNMPWMIQVTDNSVGELFWFLIGTERLSSEPLLLLLWVLTCFPRFIKVPAFFSLNPSFGFVLQSSFIYLFWQTLHLHWKDPPCHSLRVCGNWPRSLCFPLRYAFAQKCSTSRLSFGQWDDHFSYIHSVFEAL